MVSEVLLVGCGFAKELFSEEERNRKSNGNQSEAVGFSWNIFRFLPVVSEQDGRGRNRSESCGRFFLCCSDSDLVGSGAEHDGNFRELPGRIPASIKCLESHGSGRFRSGFLELGYTKTHCEKLILSLLIVF